jgi:tubulin polyglutamylase TTLL4
MEIISESGLTLVPFPQDEWFGFLNHGLGSKDPEKDPRVLLSIKNGTQNQKYNLMPGAETLAWKIEFFQHYKRCQESFGVEEFGWFLLPCFILPDELNQFKKEYYENKDKNLYIYKPSQASRMVGVEIIRNIQNLSSNNQSAIVQLFLPNPFLLDGAKVEPRISVLVTSIHPLRVYIYDEAIVKVYADYQEKMEQVQNSGQK